MAKISIRSMAARVKKRFSVPMVFSILTFVIAAAAVWATDDRSVSPLFLAALCGVFYSVLGTLLAEKRHRARLRGWFAAAGMLAGIGLYCLCRGSVLKEEAAYGLVLAAVLLCCVLAADKDRPEGSLSEVLGCLLICAAVSLLIGLILILLVSAVTTLFVKDIDWDVTYDLQLTAAAAAGLIAAPFLMFSLLPDIDAPCGEYTGLRRILAFVILPAYLMLLGLLLGYIAVILVRREMPVGQMNPFALTALGTFAALYSLLTGEENRLAGFFRRWGAWLLLPVIAAQALAVYIRISAYGLTPSRILGLAFTFVCLIAAAAGLLRKKCGRLCLAVSAALVFVLTATPLNTATLARRDQESRLFGALERAEMLDSEGRIIANDSAPEQERKIIWSSAGYLFSHCDDAPEGTRTAELIGQIKAAADNENTTYQKSAVILFGFSDPDQSGSYSFRYAYGISSATELEVEGFRYAKRYDVVFDQKGFADIGGDLIGIDDILALADLEMQTLSRSDILLDSGRTLRINYLQEFKTNSIVQYTLSAWLLTP
ncbi:MAG: DUF4153 domain-containing protein [Clostridia bacterium]|nr:DUF4153 domain-containing protein [Clostridia bacterium]